MLRHDVALDQLTTVGQSGVLSELLVVHQLSDLRSALQMRRPYHVLGKGSNVLIDPRSTRQFIQIASDFYEPEVVFDGDTVFLTVSAGLGVHDLMKLCVRHGVGQLTFCAGVPASMGGMAAMNFGCWGQSFSDVVERVLVVDGHGDPRWMDVRELGYGYRTSVIQGSDLIVLAVTLRSQRMASEQIKAQMQSAIQTRLAKQPLRSKTFGSIFKNPPGLFAAQLLEKSGLKGYRYKGIGLSDQHANFLVNIGGATFEDIVDFLTWIQSEVRRQQTVDLELEVRLLR